MFEIYVNKGMNKDDAKEICNILERNPKTWVSIMMIEELGLIYDDTNPILNAVVTFFSFVLFGSIPILPFFVEYFAKIEYSLILYSLIMSLFALFILGSVKSLFSYIPWWKGGLETLGAGIVAAGASYLIGVAFENISL
jgi:VIT1/CCC1 family predicted Fe2+/Mn2+ transporter